MKHLLIVHHSQSGSTEQLVEACCTGINKEQGIELRVRTALEADHGDLLWAQGLILATPENFGYMSGAMKYFFDRTFYKVEHLQLNLPYGLLVSAGNDGAGAISSIQRIVKGYPFKLIAEPVLAKGSIQPEHIKQAEDLGQAMAAGLLLGIF